MNLLKKLTKKNLLLNKKRTIVTIIGIILSVSLITAVSSLYFSLISSLVEFEKHEQGNFHVAFYDVPVSDISRFENNRGIESIFLTENIGYAKLDNSKNPNKPYVFVKGFSQDSLDNLSVNLVSGRLPQNNNEIVIPTHLKTNGRITINVGDTITLDIGTRITKDGTILTQNDPYPILDENELPIEEQITNSKTITYKVVGIIERPPYNIESYTAPGYTFITKVDNGFNNTVDVYAKYNKNGIKNNASITAGILGLDEDLFARYHEGGLSEDEGEEVIAGLSTAKYKIQENSYLISLETNPLKNSAIGDLGTVVIIVCLIIIFTSVFCIKNSFEISITEKIKQYGMLRSIGATKKQIKKNVFYEATILGLIGIPLGLLAGILASYILIIVTNHFLSSALNGEMLKFSFSFLVLLIDVILSIITIYLSAIRSAHKAAKVSPIESICNSANIKIKTKSIKCPRFVHKIFGIGGEISYKNLKRNKRKYRTTVISIVVSVFTFISLSSFMQMAFKTVNNNVGVEEYNLYFFAEGSEVNKNIPNIISLDGIEEYAIQRSTQVKLNNVKINKKHQELTHYHDDTYQNLVIMAVGDDAYQKYVKKLHLNYEDVKDKGILIDQVLYSLNNQDYRLPMYNFHKNDVLSITTDTKTFDIKLSLVTTSKPFSLANSEYNSKLIVSDELYNTYFTNNDKSYVFIKANNASKVQDEIDEILKDYDYYLNNSEEDYKMMNNFFTLLGIFLYGFIIVISLIGITNIFNTITTTMELRKQEFAMLKSIGMTKKEFNRMIRLESLFMGLKSLTFGIPLGVCLSYLIYLALVGEEDIYHLPINSIIIAIASVFLLIACIMKYSINKINKQNIIETIRNENI